MRVHDGQLSYRPFLPKQWTKYSFRQVFRDRIIEVTVDHNGTTLKLITGEPIDVQVDGTTQTLTQN